MPSAAPPSKAIGGKGVGEPPVIEAIPQYISPPFGAILPFGYVVGTKTAGKDSPAAAHSDAAMQVVVVAALVVGIGAIAAVVLGRRPAGDAAAPMLL